MLKPAKDKVIEKTFSNAIMKHNFCTIVVEDTLITNQKSYNSFLNFDFKNRDSNLEKDLVSDLDRIQSLVPDGNFNYVTKNQLKSSSQGLGISMAYLAIYLGIIFMIASAAILAIQQLSESDDNIQRYNLLRKIGVEDHAIYQSVFRQVGIYFLVPLLLAIVHSIVGLKISMVIVNMFGSGNSVIQLVCISGGFIIVVYGGYFLATYFGAKNIVKNRI